MSLTEKEFSDTLQILSDFKENPKYLVGFSGGTDSLALLTLCAGTVGPGGTVAVYVNHNLRTKEELDSEMALNRKNCAKIGVKLIERTIEEGAILSLSKESGIEAAARKKRYEILEEECTANGCDYILTAHHRDDQTETVLMKIMQNSPVTGLRGISEKWNNVLRPLLEFSKEELKQYLSEKGLVSSSDSTNNDNNIRRNEIRNLIIPELKNIMPDYEERILRIRNKAVSMCRSVPTVEDSIDVETFKKLDDVQKTMVLYEMWDNVIGTSMPQTLVRRVIENIVENKPGKVSANGGMFYSYNGTLYLLNNKDEDVFGNFRVRFEQEMEKITLPFGYCIERVKTDDLRSLYIDFSCFKGQPWVRFAEKGESIKLKDGTKTIGKLLQDMKIPEALRGRVPVIADDEGLCVVFGSIFGGKDRICIKLRSGLAPYNYIKYICHKGNLK